MVDAHRVVTEADEPVGQSVGLLVREVERREAEVHAVESAGDVGRLLEGELAIGPGDQPAVLAGGGVAEALRREVEGGAGGHVKLELQRNPLRPCLDRDGFVEFHEHTSFRPEHESNRHRHALPEGGGLALRPDSCGKRRTPAPVVLEQHPHRCGRGDRVVEGHVQALAAREAERKRIDPVVEEGGGPGRDRREGAVLAAGAPRAAGEGRLGHPDFDVEAVERQIGGGHERVDDPQRAVSRDPCDRCERRFAVHCDRRGRCAAGSRADGELPHGGVQVGSVNVARSFGALPAGFEQPGVDRCQLAVPAGNAHGAVGTYERTHGRRAVRGRGCPGNQQGNDADE